MGGSESKQADSEYFENVRFFINTLVCGDYNEGLLERDLENVKKVPKEEGLNYIKKGYHKNIKDWEYFFFKKNNSIGDNTKHFIQDNVKNKNYKNLILFYSGLKNFTYKNLLEYYDNEADSYHTHIIIVTKKDEEFELPELKKLNPEFIKNVKEDNFIGLQINIIEAASYCNELGDEIGFPKEFVDEKLVDKDCQLMFKDSFTFNILVCGIPGCGKSLLINRILGKLKCFSAKGTDSLTKRIVKYIHDKLPLVIYDTPGFQKEEDTERVIKLVNDKNRTLNEEKNKIHLVFYCLNAAKERTFDKNEINFLKFLLEQNMNIFFVITHSGTKEKVKDYIEATKLSLYQNSNGDKRLENLGKSDKYIFPVELKDEGEYKKFGIEQIFSAIYERFKNQKIENDITKYNIDTIKSVFLGEIKSKEYVKKRLTALANRVKANFKILASSMGQSYDVKGTTMISTSVIKIIAKLYNHPITTDECLDYIQSKGYTNELIAEDTSSRKVQKCVASLFYKNGPAAKQINYLAECLIDDYNKEINIDRKYFGYLNSYKNGINEAIENLKKIKD